MAAGIYVIRVARKPIGAYREYVGQAQDFAKRWREHRRLLRHGRHPNAKLQRAFSKYGIDAFTFVIIEEVANLELLNDREHFHADQRKPYYNISPLGGVRRGMRGLRFSEKIERQVESEYFKILNEGRTPSAVEIALHLGISRRTVDYVFRFAPWWSSALGRAASLDGLKKGHETMAALGHPELKKASEIQRQSGFAGLVKARQVAKEMGYPGTRASIAKQAERGFPNLAKGRARNAALGHPELAKGRATMRASGWDNLRKAREVARATGYAGRKACHPRKKPTDKNVQQGVATCLRVLEAIKAWYPASLQPVSGSVISSALGISKETVLKYMRRLHAQGLIDEYHRPTDAEYRPVIQRALSRQERIDHILDWLHDHEDEWRTGISDTAVARGVGLDVRIVNHDLRAMRTGELIDEHNRLADYVEALGLPHISTFAERIMTVLSAPPPTGLSPKANPYSISQVALRLRISPATAMHHIHALRAAGLIDAHNRPITLVPPTQLPLFAD